MPKGTPDAVIARLFAELNKVMNTMSYKEKAAIYGYDIGSESPAQFGQFVKDEISKWGKVIKDANIKIEN